MPHRRLVLALAFTIGVALIAFLFFVVPVFAKPGALPIRTTNVSATAPPVEYTGPAADVTRAQLYAEIARGVETDRADAAARWYTEIARQQQEAATAAAHAKRSRPAPSGSSDPVPVHAGTGSATDAIARYFPDLYQSALGVAQCESSLDPGEVSPGGGNWGLFQINSVHRGDFEAVTGRPWSDVLDAYANAQYARYLYDQQGWGPWACRWAA